MKKCLLFLSICMLWIGCSGDNKKDMPDPDNKIVIGQTHLYNRVQMYYEYRDGTISQMHTLYPVAGETDTYKDQDCKVGVGKKPETTYPPGVYVQVYNTPLGPTMFGFMQDISKCKGILYENGCWAVFFAEIDGKKPVTHSYQIVYAEIKDLNAGTTEIIRLLPGDVDGKGKKYVSIDQTYVLQTSEGDFDTKSCTYILQRSSEMLGFYLSSATLIDLRTAPLDLIGYDDVQHYKTIKLSAQ